MGKLREYKQFYCTDIWWVLGYLAGVGFFGQVFPQFVPWKLAEFAFITWFILPLLAGLFVLLARAADMRDNWWIRRQNKDREQYEAERAELAKFGPRIKRLYNWSTGRVEETTDDKR